MCEPRLKSQRVEGRERDAGCDLRRGMSKRERVAIPPAARREVEIEIVLMIVVVVEDILVGSRGCGGFVRNVIELHVEFEIRLECALLVNF